MVDVAGAWEAAPVSVLDRQLLVRDRDVEHVAAVMSRAAGLVARFEQRLPVGGRPRGWTARQMLTVFLLHAATSPDFRLDQVPVLLAGLTRSQRKTLGLPSGQAGVSPFSRRQISRAWATLSSMIDTFDPTVGDQERERRESFSLAVQVELLAATVPPEVLTHRAGHVAVDATKVWSWGRPRTAGRDKLDAAEPVASPPPTAEEEDPNSLYLSAEESTPDTHPAVRGGWVPGSGSPELLPSGRRRRRDAGKRATGAAWVGDTNPAKSVFGYQHHVGVLTPPPDRAWSVPTVAMFCSSGPANANPATMSIPALLAYDRYRRSISRSTGLVEVLADGGYTQLHRFLEEIRTQEIDLTFRLHGRNQEGVRGSVADGQVLIIDGRPHCSCAPYRDLTYPWRPQADRSDYLTKLAWRSKWQLSRMQTSRTRSSVRYRSPHHGTGCTNCQHLRPADRCCQQATYSVPKSALRLHQAELHGSPEWQDSYARRSRVEGFFGMLKNPAVAGVSRLTARFFEFGKIALATLLRVAATNLAMVSAWEHRRAQAADHQPPAPLASHLPTSDPTPVTADAGANVARRGPPGLAHLATDP